MRQSIILAALLLASSYAGAQSVSYDYLELGYQSVDIDNGPSGNGWSLGGSFSFAERWYGFANFSNADFNFGIDLEQLAVGAGYHLPLSKATDFFAELAYIDASAGANGFDSADDNGFGASIGARGMLTPKFELQGTISYVDLGGGADGTALGAEGWYHFNPQFAGGVTTAFGDDANTIGLALRWNFKN